MSASSMRRVGLIDITVGNAGVPWRIATFRHATLRVAPDRYATREPLGHPGGSRAFSADGPPEAPVAPRRSCEADEFAASGRDRTPISARALITRWYAALPSRREGQCRRAGRFEMSGRRPCPRWARPKTPLQIRHPIRKVSLANSLWARHGFMANLSSSASMSNEPRSRSKSICERRATAVLGAEDVPS
jgi:hypothetical protein